MADLLIKVAIGKSSFDADKLRHYESASCTENDFAGVAFFILKKRVSVKSCDITVGEINEILDKISNGCT